MSTTKYNNIYELQIYKMRKSKVSPSRRLKNMLKPVLNVLFKSKAQNHKRNSYVASEEGEMAFDWLNIEMDNMANDYLEKQLIQEMKYCDPDDAIVIIDADGNRQMQYIDKDDLYVPVHFANTNSGTFFWTSMQKETIEPYNIEWNFLDRWAQA